MATTWYPDVCPPGGQCIIRIAEKRTDKLQLIVRLCPHHMKVKFDNGLTDEETHLAIHRSSEVREAARWAAKLELGLHKEHPGVPYRVEANGDITVMARGVMNIDDAGNPTFIGNESSIQRARVAANAAIASKQRPTGTSKVTVE